MKIMLLASFLIALIAPARAEDKPAAGGGNPEIQAERQEYKKERQADREAFKEKRKEKREAHKGKIKEMRKKARKERMEKKEGAAEAAPAPAVK